MNKQVAVIGGGSCSAEVAARAEEVGAVLARRGIVVVTGGLGGVMEAACRGAQKAGGLTVGILPGSDAGAGNRWLDIVIPTGLGHARNVLVVASGQAVIALPGEHGTASEIHFARVLGRPVVGLGAWGDIAGVHCAQDPESAVGLACRLCGWGG
ncbi:MAG: TIGR00725 family protein [Candidatus Binatia bacterium]|nr:MAG: TIGR00725 family protein [Candidatus Binatia bacterium]